MTLSLLCNFPLITLSENGTVRARYQSRNYLSILRERDEDRTQNGFVQRA